MKNQFITSVRWRRNNANDIVLRGVSFLLTLFLLLQYPTDAFAQAVESQEVTSNEEQVNEVQESQPVNNEEVSTASSEQIPSEGVPNEEAVEELPPGEPEALLAGYDDILAEKVIQTPERQPQDLIHTVTM